MHRICVWRIPNPGQAHARTMPGCAGVPGKSFLREVICVWRFDLDATPWARAGWPGGGGPVVDEEPDPV
eukprot:9500924-Pyramimonas_sp.AAC.2